MLLGIGPGETEEENDHEKDACDAGGADAVRPAEEIDAEQFIAVKGFKAKGKRITTFEVESIEELEPVRFPEEAPEEDTDAEGGSESADGAGADENVESTEKAPEAPQSPQIVDEKTGQLSFNFE